MTKKRRRVIFWIFVAAFIVASIIVILFAQGWYFDFKSFKIIKTGGIFIKTSVFGAKIYIDDKYAGTTSGVVNYTKLIGNLAQKNYNVFIYKEGYYPWNKAIEVKNGLVTELFYVSLFPLDFKKIRIAELPKQPIYNFSIDDQKIKIISSKNSKNAKIYDSEGKLLSVNVNFKISTSTEIISPDKNKKLRIENNKIFIYYLNDSEKAPYKKAGEKEEIAASESPILFLDWIKDSEHVVWLANNEFNAVERDNRGGKRNSIKIYLNIDPPFFWDTKNSDLYFFETNNKNSVLFKISME